jgi:16S rRNA (guanine527-N7)-methyltransferase
VTPVPAATPTPGLQALVARHGLAQSTTEQFQALVELLSADPLAPTTVRDPTRVVEDHLADSLVALDLEEVRSASRIADLGAGAGVPGLPLAIALPTRKCEFISRAATACRLANASVAHVRAEAWREGVGQFDLITARALASLPVVAEYAAPLLAPGGALLAWRGRLDPAEDLAAAGAADALGLRVMQPRRVQPYPAAVNRHLQLIVKVAPTPERFPRRPGMARKRPLGIGRAEGAPYRAPEPPPKGTED